RLDVGFGSKAVVVPNRGCSLLDAQERTSPRPSTFVRFVAAREVIGAASGYYASTESNQSYIRAKASRLAPTSQCAPAPSASLNLSSVFGHFRCSKSCWA